MEEAPATAIILPFRGMVGGRRRQLSERGTAGRMVMAPIYTIGARNDRSKDDIVVGCT